MATSKVWGIGWRIPTKDEMKALVANCDWRWTIINGVSGVNVPGKDDYWNNHILFPASGCYIASRGELSSLGLYEWLLLDYWRSRTSQIPRFLL